MHSLTLEFDFILDNESLSLIVDLLRELGGNGMMGSCVLNNKTLIAFHAFVDTGLLDGPFSNVCPLLIFVGALGVLLSVGRLPSCIPIVGELLNEVALDLARLRRICQHANWKIALLS